jgi:hypothetical protein
VTPEQLKRRNALVGEGQRRAWRDPDIRARRTAAIRAAQEDPLYRAIERNRIDNRQRDENGKFL